MVTLKTRMTLIDLPIVLSVLAVLVGIYVIVKVDLVIGIVMTACSAIYAIPLSCMFCVERRKTIRAAMLISANERISIGLLSQNIGCNEGETKDKVLWCLNHDYIPGYLLINDEVVHSKLTDPRLQEHAVECPNCGASFTYSGNIGECPYCGDYYPPRKK